MDTNLFQNEFELSNFPDIKLLAPSSPTDSLSVLLSVIDPERYQTTVVNMFVNILINYALDDNIENEYRKLLEMFDDNPKIFKTLALTHAKIICETMNPSPDNIPASDTATLVEDILDISIEKQGNILLNAYVIYFATEASKGHHPFKTIIDFSSQSAIEVQEELVSNVMTQYIRHWHSTRQNSN